jgi:5-formyltetrahydrofolate cyclo-ligase
MSLNNDKTQLRKALKDRRAKLPPQQRARFSKAIAERLFCLDEIQQAQTFFVYISSATEVNTHEILKRLLAEGQGVAVPKITSSKRMEAHRFTDWAQLIPGSLGILTPAQDDRFSGFLDIAITPGLGFTESGDRIGFGAGYYDRWFAEHPRTRRIALAFEVQIAEFIPTEANDLPVDLIITERRLIQINGT